MQDEKDVVVDSAETTTPNQESYEQDDSDSEGESTEAPQSSEQRTAETAEQRTARLKRQIEREAKKAGVSVEEYLGISRKEGGKESEEVDSYAEKYNRLALKTEGITDKSEQDIVLDYADWKGIDVEEALKSPVVKAEIKELRDKASTPRPSSRTSKSGSSSVDSLVARYKAGKYLTPDEMKQVRQKLRG